MKSPERRNICLVIAVSLVCPQSSSIFKTISIWHTKEWTNLSFGWRKVERSPGKNLMLSSRRWTKPTQQELRKHRQSKVIRVGGPICMSGEGSLGKAGRAGLCSHWWGSCQGGHLLNGCEYRLWNQRNLICHLPTVWHHKHYFISLCLSS